MFVCLFMLLSTDFCIWEPAVAEFTVVFLRRDPSFCHGGVVFVQ